MTSIPNGYSYEYQNIIRSVEPMFEQLKASYPTFLSLVPIVGVASATKEEWLNDSLAPTSSTITSFDTDGDGTGINLASTAGIQAGSILRFTSALDVTRSELVRVASVDSATDLTVVRDYGGSTGVTLVVGDKVFLVSTPRAEKTNPVSEPGQEPTMDYNYTEIFDAVAEISRTAEAVKKYGIESALDYQVANKMVQIMYAMNAASLYGRRVQRSSGVEGSMGGILSFINQAGGNIESTGGNISSTILNNMLEAIFEDGGFSNNYAILCSQNQARRISAFNTSGSNPQVVKQPNDKTFGGYISQFIGDLPIQSGFVAQIVVDPNFPKDQVAIVDMNRIELAPLVDSALFDKDATLPGFDGFKRRILGEYTLRVKNAKEAHAIAVGLNV